MHYLDSIVAILKQDLIEREKSPNPDEMSNIQKKAITDGLKAIAEHYGKKLKEPIGPNSDGKFAFELRSDVFGQPLSELLSTIQTSTSGFPDMISHKPINSWCYMNAFNAETLIRNIQKKNLI